MERSPNDHASHEEAELDKQPPITRSLLRNMNQLGHDMELRYGPDYTFADTLKHLDWWIKGVGSLTALIVICVPEAALAHIKALGKGVYEKSKRKQI